MFINTDKSLTSINKASYQNTYFTANKYVSVLNLTNCINLFPKTVKLCNNNLVQLSSQIREGLFA